MATVTYECLDCGNFWPTRDFGKCPRCDGTNYTIDWDEANDKEDDGHYDVPNELEEDEGFF